MDKVYPIFFQVLKSLGVKHPSEGKQIQIKQYIIILDLFTPFVIFIAIGFFLGFISAYMILKINELELKNKILEKHILEQRKLKGLDQNVNGEIRIEEKKVNEIIKNEEEKEPLKEYKVEEVNIEEDKKEENTNTVEEIKEEIIEEQKPKKKEFVPHELKERKIVEEDWTTVKKGKKKKKPQ